MISIIYSVFVSKEDDQQPSKPNLFKMPRIILHILESKIQCAAAGAACTWNWDDCVRYFRLLLKLILVKMTEFSYYPRWSLLCAAALNVPMNVQLEDIYVGE